MKTAIRILIVIGILAAFIMPVNHVSAYNIDPVEYVSYRTETSKTYSDGDTWSVNAYMAPVHYRNDYSNQYEIWKDINTTIIDGRVTSAPYILEIGNKQFTVTDKKTGKITTIRMVNVGGKQPADKAVIYEGNKAIWKDIDTDLDIQIRAGNTQISFDWIVKSDKAPKSVSFEVSGDLPVKYQGQDADGEKVNVEVDKQGNIVTETISDTANRYPLTINPTVEVQVGDSDSDCIVYKNSGSWTFSKTEVGEWAGYASATVNYIGSGLRWDNVTVPSGATITNAYITFTAYDNYAGTTVNTVITGNLESDPAVWSDLADFQARRGTVVGGADDTKITTAQTVWNNVSAWTVDTTYNTSNINTVIQELIDQGGWNSGQAMALFWDDFDANGTQSDGVYRRARAYDDYVTPDYAPYLHIEYTVDTGEPANIGYIIRDAASGTIEGDHVTISWPSITGAVKYQVRGSIINNPVYIDRGYLVYIGTELTCVDISSMGRRTKYCVFYQDAAGTWVIGYPVVRLSRS